MPKRSSRTSFRADMPLLFPIFAHEAPAEAAMPEPQAAHAMLRMPIVREAACQARPLRIALEGPLRVGKSTLACLLAKRMGADRVEEPENNPFLPKFYAGEPGMAFAAQMWFLRERVGQMREAACLRGPVVADYMLEKDKLFAFLNLSDTELGIYKETYKNLLLSQGPLWKPDLVVYLQASPSVLLERRRRKGIESEQAIGDPYTEQICEAYDHFFSRYKASRLLVVDTSAIDFVHSERERDLLLDRILAPVHGREHIAPLAQIA